MKYFTCICCGNVEVSTIRGNRTQKYCSPECEKKVRDWRLGVGEGTCLYNDGVVCSIRLCHLCGWNPEIEKIRKESLL